ncbi:membrane integrity-associated transporter subunit PqiC [Ramlibacter sp. USB13]|uniref:Membrane integrity-associated transporter subunit PqiC n=1 Tax=Ramlibacter cellulosilyticus TaxID=2764187 RepID=A0A923MP64_9BURK|nr:ABC-type transport auxiliary lipoprotein family protein [Ramlibacter cellulosilyticus]MBC5782945.1 membrane integrity-associated transporter subunit PqiC [Ramlibacter cellulosilyticus]
MKRRVLLAALGAAGLAGCSALPEKPTRQTMYDFGPPPAAEGTDGVNRAALVLPEVEAEGILETTALLYRLGYEDPFQLRPYAFARWSAPPPQLLRQRLREVLGRDRAVLDSAAAAALVRRGADRPPVLRVELEEFSQLFDAPATSRGMLRLRCTLLEARGGGERLVAQRAFAVERPAPSADAPGGVRALTAAVDAAALDIARWLQQR